MNATVRAAGKCEKEPTAPVNMMGATSPAARLIAMTPPRQDARTNSSRDQQALYVGPVCDACATEHLSEYLIQGPAGTVVYQ